jgi:diadenosine tetraphosphatase ApaH/serine/threonine PP2A family protein phosphatase
MGLDDDRETPQPARTPSPRYRYAIRVEGLLGAHWCEWLDGMTITLEAGGVTQLEGPVMDQAALHGLLNKLRDLRLPILTVERLGAVGRDAPLSEEPPESAA